MSSRRYHHSPDRNPTSRTRQPSSSPPPRHHHQPDHHNNIQTLISDNQRLAATHVALKQELTVALQDLRHYSAVAAKFKSERENEVRVVFEKAVEMEEKIRVVGEMSADLVVVRGDVGKLMEENKEMVEKVEGLRGEIAEGGEASREFAVAKGEFDTLQKEIHKGRAAVEYEKNVYATNIEQGKAMEKSRISLAREIEKLQTDLANAKKKAMAAAAAAATNTPGTVYGAGFGNHDMGYGGNAYPGPYVGHQVRPMPPGPYDMQHHMAYNPYDMQHPNAHG